ncbi:MAG: response regulator [Oscillospiraceae bacterium]|nr:response regulator [Oscillospiraceae bacterium]
MQNAKRKLLVVDDVQLNRLILRELFDAEFDVLEAENGEVAIKLIDRYRQSISVVLLDMMMPVMDGIQVLEWMNKANLLITIPVVMITGEHDDDKLLQGYSMGISDLINKPFNPEITYRRVSNVVDLYDYKTDLERKLDEQRREIEEQQERIKQSNLFLIDALSTTVEFRSTESGDHIKRIRLLTKSLLEAIALEYSISDREIESISNASVLHDIGKISIPDAILMKPGKFTDEEFEIMKTHTLKGCEILESLGYMQDREYYNYCYEICRHHHEKWDGRGYPDGLKGDEISIWAQVTSLADVYDALTSKRVYKAAYTHEEAIRMIVNGECGQFNPSLLNNILRDEDVIRRHANSVVIVS